MMPSCDVRCGFFTTTFTITTDQQIRVNQGTGHRYDYEPFVGRYSAFKFSVCIAQAIRLLAALAACCCPRSPKPRQSNGRMGALDGPSKPSTTTGRIGD